MLKYTPCPMVIKFANHLVDGGGKGPRAWQMEIRDTRSFFICLNCKGSIYSYQQHSNAEGFDGVLFL